MKGYVPTPTALVDEMVRELFSAGAPNAKQWLLEPGCGDGEFIEGVLRWCRVNDAHPPRIVGVELNPSLAAKARRRFAKEPSVEIVHADYLLTSFDRKFNYVVGNPPYVSLEHIDERQRKRYRQFFSTAHGRFDLYMLFFEQALRQMADAAQLVFVTPEKFLYVASAAPLRTLLAQNAIDAIALLDESTFADRTVYPTITNLRKSPTRRLTKVILRDLTEREIVLPSDGASWWPGIMGYRVMQRESLPLADFCLRISAGVATGADQIFVRPIDELTPKLRAYGYPALAGRDLTPSEDKLPVTKNVLLVPYDEDGTLLPEGKLGSLGMYLRGNSNRAKLDARTCVRRKPWYAFHDNCPLPDILRPKILCKDIGQRPKFWIDRSGEVLPLHTVYYLVPHYMDDLDPLCEWLNSAEATDWLTNHCQRAANGFLRLQSSVLRNLPVPSEVIANRRMQAS